MKNRFLYIAIAFSAFFFVGCEKSLEYKQDGSLTTAEAIKTPADLQMVLNGIYDVFANTMNGNVQTFNELLSDNLNKPKTNADYNEMWVRNTIIFNGSIGSVYADAYRVIERANVLISNVDNVAELTAEDKTRMLAEARFMRAYMHFELVKLFAQPYGFTADNSHPGIVIRKAGIYETAPRTSVAGVYSFILEDLKAAHENLPVANGNYASSDAASALLAKVYFQMMDYSSALPYLNEVIDGGRFTLGSINRFQEDVISPETIFGIVSTTAVADDRSGVYKGNYTSNDPELNLRSEFVRETFITLPDTSVDLRAAWFTISNEGLSNERYILNKFPLQMLNMPLLYLTDMKLLRAEANVRMGTNLDQAIKDVNDIRMRAQYNVLLPANSSSTDILNAVYRERRIEMCGEGDWVQHLKRRGASGESIDIRGAVWNCPGMVLQFPSTENTNIFDMNPEGGC
tara:strand:+ start:49278 stop:50651 length:1374 start_codon:yes stop_codon:yes gene_type:complete